MRLHHVQVSCPPGGEEAARRFYGDGLGMSEIPKPPALAGRGGVWFRDGSCEIHVGVEYDFRAAAKAHPAILVDDIDATSRRLLEHGFDVEWDGAFPGYRRFYCADGNRNRVEVLSPS
jgi:catechol 2,3-dioxygenase-like lactoylglutathione lyase family enzyme